MSKTLRPTVASERKPEARLFFRGPFGGEPIEVELRGIDDAGARTWRVWDIEDPRRGDFVVDSCELWASAQ